MMNTRSIGSFATLLSVALSGCAPDDGPVMGSRLRAEEVGQTSDAVTKKCDGTPSNGPVQGRDVSTYQGAFDWAAQKSEGVVFGLARINYGTNALDNQWTRNWSEMKRLGILRGGYQFFLPSHDEVAQANIVIQALGKLGDGDLPAVLDLEDADGQSAATIAAKVHRWLDLVEAGTGKRPIIYTGSYFFEANVGDASLAKYPLWMAAYTACPYVMNGWTDWTFWQYSNGDNLLDHDVFNGSLAELQALAGSPAPVSCDTFRSGPFAFSDYGALPNMTCTNVNEPDDPNDWSDNYFCSDTDLGIQWSFAGPIAGMTCTNISEPAEHNPEIWADNYLCLPPDAPYEFAWGTTGPLPNYDGCVRWYEMMDAAGSWADNYLCYRALTPASVTPDAAPSGDGPSGNGSLDNGIPAPHHAGPDAGGCSVRTPGGERGSLSAFAGILALVILGRRRPQPSRRRPPLRPVFK